VQNLTSKLAFFLVAFLCACGNNGTVSPPPSRFSQISGNWQLDLSSNAGISALTISGALNVSGGSLTGSVHVTGSPCFDPVTTVPFSGTISSAGDVQLSSANVAGQVITINGKVSLHAPAGANSTLNGTLDGTYMTKGGCAEGDNGTLTGVQVPLLNYALLGTFTPSTGQAFDATIDAAQDQTASSAGSFAMKGTASFTAACFNSGSLNAGTFPAGSFIVGKFVTLRIGTSNGVITLTGAADPVSGQVTGAYSISGGTCDQNGTASLAPSSAGLWDYDRNPPASGQ
jgi:hypothetical protein